ncbi:GNAT family N-acetyltransferase [Pseudoalteromonas sp. Isolate6]|uniref:GNAT family N-acetyltransferase n=1 Tax=Pseudoalteromonas sp. Isolate6 TaxID=2908527 RepID=UPI001EFDC0A8|nr:GNAT family N-acetyltransferase [Pseudoalteromonas sp. Isolate6]MCG9761571.1 GNAT family N-acetyltransferase [Pseudoalteromonas sp. Isolate6]
MNISLRAIDKHNYEAICDLDVSPGQQDLVACNMFSIVESKFNDGYTTRAIYHDDEAVGMLMWVQESIERISIWRFMVDQQFQQQGIGRKALTLALEEIKQTRNLTTIEICYIPSNPVAKSFYASFGFEEVGIDKEDGEMLAVIKLPL